MSRALGYGYLTKPDSCQRCRLPKRLEAHHYMGYARENWLVVEWLCRPCHHRTHRDTDQHLLPPQTVIA